MFSIDEHFGRQLRRRRRLVRLTQHQVAAAVGVRFQQIHKYECGASKLSAAMLWKLACALDTPVEYFFEGLEQAQTWPSPNDGSRRAVDTSTPSL